MKIASILEDRKFEKRIAVTPETAKKYISLGFEVSLSENYGNHLGINEYLGELYVQTNRIELAKERLQVLNGCNCEEYNELKELIEKN